jgi:hypothetical protein
MPEISDMTIHIGGTTAYIRACQCTYFGPCFRSFAVVVGTAA